MKRPILSLLAAVVAGGALFGWGYRRGAASVEVRDSVVVRWLSGPVVHDTIREPSAVLVREPADTVWRTLPADTAAILADYLRERDYRLDFSTDSTGRFLVDATVGRNRLLSAAATVEPLLREVTTRHTVIRTVVQPPRWEIGPAVGAWTDPVRDGVWVGGYARRSFGRVNVSAAAGYDARSAGFCAQVQAGVAVWRK
ncbi:hypothetical protein [Alistipes sp.]|uniref:hypothetical protein n=1 Tax=Alistipes sp. TaxID=1872444 RepID=UPI003AEF5F17